MSMFGAALALASAAALLEIRGVTPGVTTFDEMAGPGGPAPHLHCPVEYEEDDGMRYCHWVRFGTLAGRPTGRGAVAIFLDETLYSVRIPIAPEDAALIAAAFEKKFDAPTVTVVHKENHFGRVYEGLNRRWERDGVVLTVEELHDRIDQGMVSLKSETLEALYAERQAATLKTDDL